MADPYRRITYRLVREARMKTGYRLPRLTLLGVITTVRSHRICSKACKAHPGSTRLQDHHILLPNSLD
jgi:hypothetical protein